MMAHGISSVTLIALAAALLLGTAGCERNEPAPQASAAPAPANPVQSSPPPHLMPKPPAHDPTTGPPPYTITPAMRAWADRFEQVDLIKTTKVGGDYLRALLPTKIARDEAVIMLTGRNATPRNEDELLVQAVHRSIIDTKRYVRVKHADLIIVVPRTHIESWRGITIDAEHIAGTAYRWTYRQ
ncbi:MAG: hypothetical protein WD042_12690 [Phycisphaeraceae bacterium]